MDVVVWLRGLGLGKYEAVFRDNEIDETVLPNLTAEDLKDLGAGIVGHRRKLLEALRQQTRPLATPPNAVKSRGSRWYQRVTRRLMFSDLVGSTALSARMDPEDLREVISAYQKCVAETVGRFGGFVAKYMGDGVLIYFGYPQAHEDDAERAVRAGLRRNATHSLASSLPIAPCSPSRRSRFRGCGGHKFVSCVGSPFCMK
jgi:class 3 adenylate cyclase